MLEKDGRGNATQHQVIVNGLQRIENVKEPDVNALTLLMVYNAQGTKYVKTVLFAYEFEQMNTVFFEHFPSYRLQFNSSAWSPCAMI